jgi:hypothetical protein
MMGCFLAKTGRGVKDFLGMGDLLGWLVRPVLSRFETPSPVSCHQAVAYNVIEISA